MKMNAIEIDAGRGRREAEREAGGGRQRRDRAAEVGTGWGKRLTFEITGTDGKPKVFEMERAEGKLREAGGGGEGMRMVRE